MVDAPAEGASLLRRPPPTTSQVQGILKFKGKWSLKEARKLGLWAEEQGWQWGTPREGYDHFSLYEILNLAMFKYSFKLCCIIIPPRYPAQHHQ